MKKMRLVFLGIVFIFLFFTTIAIHPFGEPSENAMDRYMIEHGQNETASNNIVTSVVFDYRGYDTLGEATVLFTAVTGVIMALRKLHGGK